MTDTCIPEEEAMRKIEHHMLDLWQDAEKKGERNFPHEYFYKLLLSKKLESGYEIDPKNSWLLAAAEQNLPMWVPGWEDSTLGNMFVAGTVRGEYDFRVMKGGLEYMRSLMEWYKANDPNHSIGFFQIAGGIAGDFPICVVPMMNQDLELGVRTWGYFCQISDSTTSYGSYSGAPPGEKITWEQARGRHAALRDRVRRDHRLPADRRVPARHVTRGALLRGSRRGRGAPCPSRSGSRHAVWLS